MFMHILLPTDGSERSTKAAKQAIEVAKALGARITAVHVKPTYQLYLDDRLVIPTTTSAELKRQQFREDIAKISAKILAAVKAAADDAGVQCNTISLIGDSPYEAIIKQAEKSGCDLIMMASHGRRGLEALLLGNETVKVLTHSAIPVLVCR